MARQRHRHYDEDDQTFSSSAYRVRGYSGIAFSVLGWETELDEDTEWTGQEVRTGNVLVVMIGDDQKYAVDPEDVSPISREDYCGECGQMGCTHDGYDRSTDNNEDEDHN